MSDGKRWFNTDALSYEYFSSKYKFFEIIVQIKTHQSKYNNYG